MPLWFSVSLSLWSHSPRDCSQPHSHINWSKALPTQAARRSRGPCPSSWSLPTPSDWLLSPTTAQACMRNAVVLQGEVSGGNTALKGFRPPLQFISSPTLQYRAASALPAQLGEQRGMPWTALVKGFTSGNPSLCRRSKRLQASMPYSNSSLTQPLYWVWAGNRTCIKKAHRSATKLSSSILHFVGFLPCLSSSPCSEALMRQRKKKPKARDWCRISRCCKHLNKQTHTCQLTLQTEPSTSTIH